MNGPDAISPPHHGPGRFHAQRNSIGDTRAQPPPNGFASQGSMPVPMRAPGMSGQHNATRSGGIPTPGAFQGLSRSPPAASNTKHVPCKFFIKGECTAGDACPYSHDLEHLEPCKFFLNGNCKFGNKCMLPHIVNGRIVNSPRRQQSNGRVGAPMSTNDPRMSGAHGLPPQGLNGIGTPQQHLYDSAPMRSNPWTPPGTQTVDYGNVFGNSPPRDMRMGLSPNFHGYSALDSTLPASYSSQDLPNIVKFGPNAASMPAKSGWGPLTGTSPTTSTASHQAFANLDSLTLGEARMDLNNRDLGVSPPSSRVEVEPRRIMHSDRRSISYNVSSSLPAHARPIPQAGHDAGHGLQDDAHGEDLLPSSLNELLTPQEKLRRFSRSEDDHGLSGRRSVSSFGSPPDSKVGSPSHASPSRFGALFAEMKDIQDSHARPGSSPFGHVGSPLRNSTTTASLGPARDSHHSPSFGPISPPRSSQRPAHVSSLSEQLKGVHIASSGKNDQGQLSTNSVLRNNTTPMNAATGNSSNNGAPRWERTLSGNFAVGRERIDEEPVVFSMESDEDVHDKQRRKSSGKSSHSGGQQK